LAHFKENGKIPMECVYMSAYLDEEKKEKENLLKCPCWAGFCD